MGDHRHARRAVRNRINQRRPPFPPPCGYVVTARPRRYGAVPSLRARPLVTARPSLRRGHVVTARPRRPGSGRRKEPRGVLARHRRSASRTGLDRRDRPAPRADPARGDPAVRQPGPPPQPQLGSSRTVPDLHGGGRPPPRVGVRVRTGPSRCRAASPRTRKEFAYGMEPSRWRAASSGGSRTDRTLTVPGGLPHEPGRSSRTVWNLHGGGRPPGRGSAYGPDPHGAGRPPHEPRSKPAYGTDYSQRRAASTTPGRGFAYGTEPSRCRAASTQGGSSRTVLDAYGAGWLIVWARTRRHRGLPSSRRPRAVKGAVVTVNPAAASSARTALSGQVL